MSEWLESLARRAEPPSSAVSRAVAVLREHIVAGQMEPGTFLRGEQLAEALMISRNTLREVLRVLEYEGLVIQEPNRGFYVRQLDFVELLDAYRVRELLLIAAINAPERRDVNLLDQVKLTIDEGEASQAAGDWIGVMTANLRFHKAMVGLLGSARLDLIMDRLAAELRLAFSRMRPAEDYLTPYVALNRRIYESVADGRRDQAIATVREYMTTSLDLARRAYDVENGVASAEPEAMPS